MATKLELAKKMMERNKIIKNNRYLNKKEMAQVIDGITASITELLAKDGRIQLTGFGAFEKRERAARTGFNPQTGEKIKIPSTLIPAFKPGKDLKEAVKPKVNPKKTKGRKNKK